jgi:hypothetical protein
MLFYLFKRWTRIPEIFFKETGWRDAEMTAYKLLMLIFTFGGFLVGLISLIAFLIFASR